MDKFEGLEKAMCKELEMLEQKVKGSNEMSVQDLEKIDKLAHALKSLATYKAMKEAEEYEQPGMSGYRGRAKGGSSYMDGYRQGYAHGMNQPMMSGYPNW